ncbi:ATP-dependent DNA helicase PIF1 [Hirsutella rhossiliensis]
MLAEEVAVPEGVQAEQHPIEHPDPEAVENADAAGIDDYDAAAVPNFIAAQADLERLRAQLEDHEPVPPEQIPLRQAHIEMPNIRSTPLNEFNRSQPLLSLAFPTLYPTGQADFVAPRQRTIRSFFVKRPGLQQRVDMDELRNAFEEDTPESRALLSSIVRFSSSLKGTRAYWGGQRHQLEALVHGLTCPGVFLTFSAADLHWDSLQRHMPSYVEWREADSRGKGAIAFRNLLENPHIAAYHFHSRFTSFLKIVSMPKFNITDYWFRYEWQARGSTHVHGLYWVRDTPKPDMSTLEGKAEFARFWAPYVSAINPEPLRVMQQGDANPLYCSKAEKQTESYRDVARAILPRVNARQGLVSFVAKFMNKLTAERDWSAMEINHLLLSLPLQQSTRTPYIGKYPDLAILGHDYWKELKASHPLGNNQDDVPDGLFDQLNVEQRTVFDLFTRHLEKALDPQQPNPAPLLVQVDGEGGTGPTDIANLQSKLRNLRYLIIDEKSMIGLRTFGYIDSRLRQIFPEYQDTFSAAQGEEQAPFRTALQSLRINAPTVLDWELLCTRVQANLTLAEVTCFDGAVRIYTTNAQVRATNLPICIGARVMLTENVWTDVSLVNGALGTIYDFAYEDHVQDPQAHHPFVIMPIFRSWRDFIKGTSLCTRHRSGLTYVAVSRAKTLNGIMFDASFDLNDIRRRTDGSMAARAADAARRAGQVVTAQEALN